MKLTAQLKIILQKPPEKRKHTIKSPIIRTIVRTIALSILFLLLFQLSNYGQIDPKKVDSLSRLIDSSAHVYKVQQDSVVKYQDSTNKSEVNRALQKKIGNPEKASTEQKIREQKERQESFMRIVLSALSLLVVIIALMKRRKSKH